MFEAAQIQTGSWFDHYDVMVKIKLLIASALAAKYYVIILSSFYSPTPTLDHTEATKAPNTASVTMAPPGTRAAWGPKCLRQSR